MNIKHYLYSENEQRHIAVFEYFDKEAIREAIVKHLAKDDTDIIQHEKTEIEPAKYYGNEVLNIYEANPKTGKPCLVVQKGSKTFYKPL
jgi:hypothetical protein